MKSNAKIVQLPTHRPSFFSATVCTIHDNKHKVQIESFDGTNHWYEISLHLQQYIEIGDTVLCTGGDSFFVLNLLAKKKSHTIQTFSPQQELLFEYDPETNTSRVFIDKGDLEFISTKGDITFKAAESMNFSGNTIDLAGQSQVNITASTMSGKHASLKLDPTKLAMTSSKLEINSQRGQITLEELRYTGKKCLGHIRNVQLISHKLETVAKTISQKAEYLFQKITGLHQTRAKRKHDIIEESYHLKAKQTILKSEDDFKVKAKKIHLG